MRLVLALSLLSAGAMLASGCASTPDGSPATGHDEHAAANCPWTAVTQAVAVVQPTKGNTCHGTVHFTDVEGGVRVVAEFSGLQPSASHAFHIHEFGDVSSGDGKSAGGHYNPEGHPHAGPDAAARHAGDLGNVETDATGHARYDRVITGVAVAGMHNPIVGRSVVVHAKKDDLSSQPAGNAGDRIAWGVIGVANAKPAAK